jgi:RNA-directed DNA polymerase
VFTPLPVRERLIPKGSPGKFRSLGIPSAMDRLVQASVSKHSGPWAWACGE